MNSSRFRKNIRESMNPISYGSVWGSRNLEWTYRKCNNDFDFISFWYEDLTWLKDTTLLDQSSCKQTVIFDYTLYVSLIIHTFVLHSDWWAMRCLAKTSTKTTPLPAEQSFWTVISENKILKSPFVAILNKTFRKNL